MKMHIQKAADEIEVSYFFLAAWRRNLLCFLKSIVICETCIQEEKKFFRHKAQ